MKEQSTRMLLTAVALSALAALLASRAHARIPEGTDASFTLRAVIAHPVVAEHAHSPRLGPRVVLLRASVPSRSSRFFVWPTHGTATYKRAAGMASHGDPEAQSFVSGRSDVNPFGAQ